MRIKQLVLFGGSALLLALLSGSPRALAEQKKAGLVRLAELEIDPAQLEAYKAALTEEIETSLRVEHGVLGLYAVSVKGHPTQIRIFEMYADANAYREHQETPHFRRYKRGTKEMIKSLKLTEAEPVSLGAKAR